MSVLDGEEFDRWRRHAQATRTAAVSVRSSASWEWCCFLSEQAAQPAVKALLHASGHPAQAWGHDLVALVDRAGGALGEPLNGSEVADAAARLSRHYIPARYPDAHSGGTPADNYREADAVDALADADRVLAAVDTAWDALRRAELSVPVTDVTTEPVSEATGST